MVPAVVLLRGLAREQGHWGDFAPQLSQAFSKELGQQLSAAHPEKQQERQTMSATGSSEITVLLQDLPGMGQYYQEQSPARIADMAALLQRRLQERHPGPWHLVAMSLGAMLALQLASTADTQVRSLVLVNTSVAELVPFYQRLRWQQYGKVLAALCAPAPTRERLILAMTSNSAARRSAQLPLSLQLARQQPPTRLNTLRQLWAASRFSLPARPGCPTLLLCSSQDQLVDPQCSRVLAERWQLPLQCHPWAGHDLALDDPDWLAQQICRFYQSLPGLNAAS